MKKTCESDMREDESAASSVQRIVCRVCLPVNGSQVLIGVIRYLLPSCGGQPCPVCSQLGMQPGLLCGGVQ